MEVAAGHERRQPSGASSAWCERHRLDVFDTERRLAVSFQIALRPNWGHASFLAAVLEHGRLPVVIADTEVPVPENGWEIRTSGLWADHICETPLDHWSYGLEAFALAVDSPGELLGKAVGDRVPLGWELEFEADAPAEFVLSSGAAPSSQSVSSAGSDGSASEGVGYSQTGKAHGILLSDEGEREIDAVAVRSHWWGTNSAVEVVVGDRPTESAAVVLPDEDVDWHLSVGELGLLAVPVQKATELGLC